jgi:hypothetical protein
MNQARNTGTSYLLDSFEDKQLNYSSQKKWKGVDTTQIFECNESDLELTISTDLFGICDKLWYDLPWYLLFSL